MAQILSFPCVIWLVFSRLFADKRIYISLVLVLKVKQPWKGNATMKLEPQIAAFLVNNPKCCRNVVLTQQKTNFKSILPHIILSSEGQKLTCWFGGFLLSGLVFVWFFCSSPLHKPLQCVAFIVPFKKALLPLLPRVHCR